MAFKMAFPRFGTRRLVVRIHSPRLFKSTYVKMAAPTTLLELTSPQAVGVSECLEPARCPTALWPTQTPMPAGTRLSIFLAKAKRIHAPVEQFGRPAGDGTSGGHTFRIGHSTVSA